MNINQKCINELRLMTASIITKANSGHTGSSVGFATPLFALFKDHYFFNPNDSEFFARDRLIISNGHISPLYYSILNLFNMGVTDEDLFSLRRLGSITPGHPEYKKTKFVEVTTGALGQGVANAVGMAIGQTMVGGRFNAQKANIIDNYTYCVCGDGCLQEGVAQEACSLAGTLKLKKLILLYDNNNITINGELKLSNTENVSAKFRAMNWNVITVNNGNSYYFCSRAIARAKRSNRPTIIIFKTTIGYGTAYAGNAQIHGLPLSEKELIEYKNDLLMPNFGRFSKETKDYCTRTIRNNKIQLEKWKRMYCLYDQTHPELCKQFESFISEREVDVLKLIKPEMLKEEISGREANALILKELFAKLPRFTGGTADVAPATCAYVKGAGNFSAENPRGRNIQYGIREHAMGAISNGLSLYLESPVFTATFLAFSGYMLPAIRMSALMNVPVIYTFTHDSFKVGQDGATHQPIEQLGQLRLIPRLNVFRPADFNELLNTYKIILDNDSPAVLALTKQPLPACTYGAKNIGKGGYVLLGAKGDVNILASGSEVSLALKVADLLKNDGIKAQVCSFPCLSLFEKQGDTYKKSVLEGCTHKVVLEASNDPSWYKYLNEKDLCVGINSFGQSGTMEELEKYFNFTTNAIYKKIKNFIKK